MPAKPVVRDRIAMIAGLSPERDPETYVFCTLPPESLGPEIMARARALFQEAEGASLILPLGAAEALGLPVTPPHFTCITLTVHSALDGVGLTASVARALAEAGIPCNMVAAFHHDHVFVPCTQAEAAMEVLAALQASARASSR